MTTVSIDGMEALTEPENFRLTVPGRLVYRDGPRAFLADICHHLVRRGRFPEDTGHRVISAFIEAFNNAVIHAYGDDVPGPVEVEMQVTPASLVISVVDYGRTFEPDLVPEPDLDNLPEGGLGLFIIRNFMDEVTYERIDNRNVLSMVLHFDKSSDDPPPEL